MDGALMDVSMHKSEIATFREQQALLDQAAQHGLSGLANVASHESITARLEIGADRILELIKAGKHKEAIELLSATAWGVEEKESADEPVKH
jgi:hypothetical protein